MLTDREALRQIETLLAQFLNRKADPDKQLVSDAMDIVVMVLSRESVENTRFSELSWRINPDRSGGQFTEDEVHSSGHWI